MLLLPLVLPACRTYVTPAVVLGTHVIETVLPEDEATKAVGGSGTKHPTRTSTSLEGALMPESFRARTRAYAVMSGTLG